MLTGFLRALRLPLVSRRGQQKRLLRSRPPWSACPLSVPTIRSALPFYSKPFSDDRVSRILLPSRIRSRYFACASRS